MNTQPVGNLRHGLIIEAPVRAGDEAGSAAMTWSFVATVWAALRPTSGREIVDADGVSARVSHEVIIRWRSDLTSAMRFHDGARIFLIRAVRDVDDRRRRLSCLVEEISA
jgi:SPP1 family predicted phage head-tail adaptor